jgi:hypothetical protein
MILTVQWMLRPFALPKRMVSTHCLDLATIRSQQLCVEQEYLIGRLKSVDTGYHQDLRCMEGTRQFLLNQVIDWSTRKVGQNNESKTYWIYGLLGLARHHWLTRSVQTFIVESTSLVPFSAGGMTRI